MRGLGGVDAGGGLFANGVDRSLHEAPGGFRGDTELVAHLAVAALTAVVDAEPLLDGIASTRLEHVEKAGHQTVLLAVEEDVLRARLRVTDQVDQLGTVVVTDGTV